MDPPPHPAMERAARAKGNVLRMLLGLKSEAVAMVFPLLNAPSARDGSEDIQAWEGGVGCDGHHTVPVFLMLCINSKRARLSLLAGFVLVFRGMGAAPSQSRNGLELMKGARSQLVDGVAQK